MCQLMKSAMNNKAGERIETDRVGLQFEMGKSQKGTLRYDFSAKA